MLDSEDDVRDDDEAIINDMSGDAAEDADGDKPGDSLKTSETSDPRKAFMDQFTTDAAIPEKEETEEEEDEANDDSEDDQKDDVSASDETPEDEAEDSTSDDDEEKPEDEDDDDIDIGVTFDDIEGVEDDEPVDDSFDPRQDLNKKVWKSTPKEAQQLITNFRRNYKHLQKETEKQKPFADWTRNLLTDAHTAGMETQDLMAYIDLGLRAHRGNPEAIAALGSRMVQHGYNPGHESPDLSPVQDYLKQQVDALEIDREVATKVLALVNGSVGSTAPTRKVAPQPQTQVANRERTSPDSSRVELETAALEKIQEMDKRLEKRFGDNWPKLRKRVQREVTLAMAENPVSPAQWAKLWKDKAEQEAKAHVKRSRSKKQSSRSRLSSNSDSLERGAPVASKESGSELSGRAGFHKQHSR